MFNTCCKKAIFTVICRSFKVTHTHWEVLIEFMETHRDFAVGRMNNSAGRQTYKKLWGDLAIKLNSLGLGERTIEKWQKSWTDYKCALKKKASEIKRHQEGTDGGPELEQKLSDLELRVLSILGETFYQGCGVTERGLYSGNSQTTSTTSSSSTPKRKVDEMLEHEVVHSDHDYLFQQTSVATPTQNQKRKPMADNNNIEQMYRKTIDLLDKINNTLEEKFTVLNQTYWTNLQKL